MPNDEVGKAPIDSELVMPDLAAMGVEAYEPEYERVDFYPRMLGGSWTASNTSIVSDAWGGFARAGLAREWCDEFQWPKQMAADYSKYCQPGAHTLVAEYCWRSQYFYDMWLYFEGAPFGYTQGMLQAYELTLEWVSWLIELPTDPGCFAKGLWINGLLPRRPA